MKYKLVSLLLQDYTFFLPCSDLSTRKYWVTSFFSQIYMKSLNGFLEGTMASFKPWHISFAISQSFNLQLGERYTINLVLLFCHLSFFLIFNPFVFC